MPTETEPIFGSGCRHSTAHVHRWKRSDVDSALVNRTRSNASLTLGGAWRRRAYRPREDIALPLYTARTIILRLIHISTCRQGRTSRVISVTVLTCRPDFFTIVYCDQTAKCDVKLNHRLVVPSSLFIHIRHDTRYLPTVAGTTREYTQCWNWPNGEKNWGEGGQMSKCLKFCPGIEI